MRQFRWALVGAALLTGYPASRLAAQIGYDPATSPYRDIFRAAGPVVFAGHLGGDRGDAGVGPSNALTFGLRYELPMGRSTLLQFTASYLKGDRYIVNPAVNPTAPGRRTGPVDTELLFTELALQIRLTGGKTWHGLAPYLGTGLGLVVDLRSPGDTTGSGYSFHRHITLSGNSGVRWHLAQKLTVQLDARAVMWRLNYPISFHSTAPDGSRVIPAAKPLTDWTLHPWVSVGIGWIF